MSVEELLDTIATGRELASLVAVAFIAASGDTAEAIAMCELAGERQEREKPDALLYPARVAAQAIREAVVSLEEEMSDG